MAAAAAYSLDGAIHFQCMDWKGYPTLVAAAAAVYSEQKNLIVWAKSNAGMGTFYRSRHELIGVFKVGTAPHRNNFGLGETGRWRSNVWEYPGMNAFGRGRDATLALHSTCKPSPWLLTPSKTSAHEMRSSWTPSGIRDDPHRRPENWPARPSPRTGPLVL
uniref:Uncharacterized protein n=1 Tax=Phenylobacterium glaciei TaxID=2803784 RepID=A0A974P5L8_9CAUL|nr:hypothetical protein JKL49_08520 [Phenylobacterium glaciei]